MARKLLVSRLGAGSITLALCAALPGCNLAIAELPQNCFGVPGPRGMSSVECTVPDASSDSTRDTTTADSASDTGGDATAADSGGEHP
jgi:hypothetical protein